MAARVIYHDFENHKQTLSPQYDPALLAIIEIIRDGLIRDSHVRLSQFGTFRLKWGKPGKGKHPMTGETITWPAQPRITFTAAKHLREQVEPNPAPLIPIENDTASQLPQTNTPEIRDTTELKDNKKNIPVLKDSPDVIAATKIISTIESKPEQEIIQETEEYIPEKYQAQQEPELGYVVDDLYDEEEVIPAVNTEATQQTGKKTFPTKKVILGAGMLALIPVIIMMLQAEFSQDVTTQTSSRIPVPQNIQRNISPAATTPAQTNFMTPEQTVLAEELNIESQEDNVSTAINDSTQTTRTDTPPDTVTHYLAPQVHTIEKMTTCGDWQKNTWAMPIYGQTYIAPICARWTILTS